MLMGGLLNNLGRPARYFVPSLLDEQPVGLWHITIGNPNHPIMSMGNMILKNTQVEHYGPLGIDDFPTCLRITCSFDRGKPRDQYGIEQLYMSGNDRVFHSMAGKVGDMYNTASKYQANPKKTFPKITHADANSEPAPKEDSTFASYVAKVADVLSNASATVEGRNGTEDDPVELPEVVVTPTETIDLQASQGTSKDPEVESLASRASVLFTIRRYFGSASAESVIMSAEEQSYGAFPTAPPAEIPSEKPKDTTQAPTQPEGTPQNNQQNQQTG